MPTVVPNTGAQYEGSDISTGSQTPEGITTPNDVSANTGEGSTNNE
jgi:hypothetical protein